MQLRDLVTEDNVSVGWGYTLDVEGGFGFVWYRC